MRATYITAAIIALLIGLWLLSGQIGSERPPPHPTPAQSSLQRMAQLQDRAPARVRGRVIRATAQTQYVRVRGRTENKRTVQVRAELTGTLAERPVERGDRVAAGDLLCRISLEDRQVSVLEAREALHQARIEYEGGLELQTRGFQSETAIARAKAGLAEAEAKLRRSELALAKTAVRAPFAGIVEEVHQEVGDYLTPGAGCATIVDLDPMLLVGRVSERDVLRVAPEQVAIGILGNGRQVAGPVSFVGQQADPATRTYRVEARIANPDYALRSGISTEIAIPVAEVPAQKVSPALFALDDAGTLGVRVVDADDRVRFHPIEILKDDSDGVWVTGLPEIATLITLGQELVAPGERVEVEFEPAVMPAAAPSALPQPGGASPAQTAAAVPINP